eukprot:COSAG03_NODE_1015_length_5017_cov_2.423749_2_plen_73_part_00
MVGPLMPARGERGAGVGARTRACARARKSGGESWAVCCLSRESHRRQLPEPPSLSRRSGTRSSRGLPVLRVQ